MAGGKVEDRWEDRVSRIYREVSLRRSTDKVFLRRSSEQFVMLSSNVWRKIKCVSFVTDEQNALSLCPTTGRRNFLPVRIPCVSVLRTYPHMYPQRLMIYVFRCLLGHGCPRSSPVVCHEVWNMVKNSQVTIDHVLVCNIHTLGLTTLLRNERCYNCRST